jgi:hypothetical protein
MDFIEEQLERILLVRFYVFDDAESDRRFKRILKVKLDRVRSIKLRPNNNPNLLIRMDPLPHTIIIPLPQFRTFQHQFRFLLANRRGCVDDCQLLLAACFYGELFWDDLDYEVVLDLGVDCGVYFATVLYCYGLAVLGCKLGFEE